MKRICPDTQYSAAYVRKDTDMIDNFARAHEQYLTPPEPPEECGECGGSGILTDEQGQETPCHVCNGEGVETKQEAKERIEEEKADAQREEQIFREQSEGYDL